MHNDNDLLQPHARLAPLHGRMAPDPIVALMAILRPESAFHRVWILTSAVYFGCPRRERTAHRSLPDFTRRRQVLESAARICWLEANTTLPSVPGETPPSVVEVESKRHIDFGTAIKSSAPCSRSSCCCLCV